MTTDTEKIADVIVAAVRVATAPIVAKCEALASTVAALETRAAVPGPPGEPGPKGDPGPAGLDAPVPADELDAVVFDAERHVVLSPVDIDGGDMRHFELLERRHGASPC